MTEAENLANEYFDNQCEHSYADTIEQLREDVVSAWLNGYAKGETDEKFRTKQIVTKTEASLLSENKKLTKANNTLIKDVFNANERISKLKSENIQLKIENEELKERLVDEESLVNENYRIAKQLNELKAQIEKMKCCENCEHQYEGQYHNGFKCKDHYKEEVCESYEWELKE